MTSQFVYPDGCTLNVSFPLNYHTDGWVAQIDLALNPHPYTVHTVWGADVVSNTSTTFILSSYNNDLVPPGTMPTISFSIYTTGGDSCATVNTVCYELFQPSSTFTVVTGYGGPTESSSITTTTAAASTTSSAATTTQATTQAFLSASHANTSSGTTAGIVVGVIVGTLLISLLIWGVVVHRRHHSAALPT